MKKHFWKLALLATGVWFVILAQYQRQQLNPAPQLDDVVAQVASPIITPVETQAVVVATPTHRVATAIAPTNSPTAMASPTPTTLPSPTPTPTLASVRHIIQAGEMPLSIAAAYGISAAELMQANNISNPSLLQIGQELVVPVTPSPTPTFSPTPATPPPTPTPSATPRQHTIAAGDTLLALAIEYETSVEAIMYANAIYNPQGLQIGQALVIPADDALNLAVPTTLHVIKQGNTLLGLANAYGSTVTDILAANPDINPNNLQLGQPVVIPLTRPRGVSPAQPSQPRITVPAPSLPGLVGIEQAMVEATNLHRAAHGYAPYISDPELTRVARAHAQDMVSRGYFGHYSPEGLNARARLREAGSDRNWVGENIIRSVREASETVQYSIDWFMNDPPHRRNLLHDRHTHVGVGAAREESGSFIIVMVFAGD